jgi:hypothetical protein
MGNALTLDNMCCSSRLPDRDVVTMQAGGPSSEAPTGSSKGIAANQPRMLSKEQSKFLQQVRDKELAGRNVTDTVKHQKNLWCPANYQKMMDKAKAAQLDLRKYIRCRRYGVL